MQEEPLSIRRGQEEAAECSERNARKENYTFKRKGKKLQYKFNDRVVDKVTVAAAAIRKVPPQVQGRSSIALRRSFRKVQLFFHIGKR